MVGGVRAALGAHAGTFDAARRVCVAFSGGLDSTVLLYALAERYPDTLLALHANHGLHGDAARWEQHCGALCAELGVRFRSETLQVRETGQGLEAAARAARYAWFARELKAGDLLLLAHHRDDQAETLLLRLLRGAGPDGLAAMPESRAVGSARLLRPFLDLPRSCLDAFARDEGLTWIEDPSNADLRFDRNYLRHRVMPVLAERWPATSATLARAARLLGEARTAGLALAPEDCFSVIGDPGFALSALSTSEPGATQALRAWLRRRGLGAPGEASLAEFLRQLRTGRGAQMPVPGACLVRFREAVFACPEMPAAQDPDTVLQPGFRADLPGIGVVALTVSRAGEDASPAASQIAGAAGNSALRLRLRRGGERLAGPDGHHRDLKAVFQSLGLPPWWRSRVPLLFERSEQGEELLAVGGLVASARCRALGLRLAWKAPVLGAPRDGASANFD